MKPRVSLLLLAGLVAVSAGCGGIGGKPDVPSVEILGEEDGSYAEFTASHPGRAGYVLGSQDVFDVDFLFDQQLSTRVKVRPDGGVSLPILGQVEAAGRTPGELDSLLTEAYSKYFKDPEINVNVIEFAPEQVYVLGKVHTPSEVAVHPGMSVIQAIAMAGGPEYGADMGSVVLLRRVGGGRAIARRIDVNAVLAGESESWDLLLSPSDIVYVPTTFVAQVSEFVEEFFGGMVQAPLFYLRTWEAFHTDQVYGRLVRFEGSTP